MAPPSANLGSTWARSELPWAMLGPTSANLGTIWSELEPTWGYLGPTWGQLGPTWCQLGANLVPTSATHSISHQILLPKKPLFPPAGGQNNYFRHFFRSYRSACTIAPVHHCRNEAIKNPTLVRYLCSFSLYGQIAPAIL